MLLTRDAVTPAGGVAPVFWLFAALYLVLAVAVVTLLVGLRRAGRPEPREPGTRAGT